MGGLLQRRGGTARHDAVAWGFARAADARGVDIIQHCEVTGIDRRRRRGARRAHHARADPGEQDRPGGRRQHLAAGADGRARRADRESRAAGLCHRTAEAAGDPVITFGAGHFYISQSDKGGLVFGGGLDGWNTYAQRGNLPVVEHVWSAGVSMMPALSRLRALRQWGGVMDMSFDGSPIIGRTPIGGLTIDGGLVLRRLQGHARLGLVPCLDDREGRAARS